MLYLTADCTGYKKLYHPFISWVHHEIRVYEVDTANNSMDGIGSSLSIIDIDHEEACVLALKGFAFKVTELVPSTAGSPYMWIAEVSDLDAVIEWEKQTFYT